MKDQIRMKIKKEKSASTPVSGKSRISFPLKYFGLLCIGLCIGILIGVLFLPAAGVQRTSIIPSSAGFVNNPDLKPASSFEGGQRYSAGPYNVIVVSGSYYEMGRQYGNLMKPELNAMYQILINEDEQKGYSVDELRNFSDGPITLLPARMKEIIQGMADTSGLTYDDVAIVYYGSFFHDSLPASQPTGCSFLATSSNYTKDGSMIVSRNFDLNDADSVFDPYYVLVVYRPDDGSNSVATISPAGMRPETLMNSKGLIIADDNGMASGGVDVRGNRPDYISDFFPFMLDCSSMREIDDDIQGARPNSAIIVNAAGPDVAYSYEETAVRPSGALSPLVRRSDSDGLLVATNHFVDPSWGNITSQSQYSTTYLTNSIERYNNLVNQANQNKGTIDVNTTMAIRDVMIDNGGATVSHADFGGLPYSTVL